MFKRVLKALFPSFVDQSKFSQKETSSSPHSFSLSDNSIPSSVPHLRDKSPASNCRQEATQRSSLAPDRPLSPHDTDFLDFLFGESDLKTESDPFSDFVASQIERLLRSPKAILNELPVMPASMTTLMSELQTEDFDINALLKVIEREPSMAADVIKLANSAFYKRGEKQVTDLKTAFMNMGSQGLIEGVINSYVKNFTPTHNIYWRQFGEKIWQHSIQTAYLSKELIKESGASEEQATAYFVGLIRNLGKMVIFQAMIEAFKHVDPSVPPNSVALKRLINSYSIRLTYTIGKFWELPEEVLTAIAFQESRKYQSTPLGQAVHEANYLSELQLLIDEEKIDAQTFELRFQQHLVTESARRIAEHKLKELELTV